MPELTEGKPFKKTGEVIANESLKEDGFQIGDKLTLSSTDVTLSIVGFADDYAVVWNFSAIASTDDAKANVSIFGIKDNEFIMPELTEGKPFKKTGEVIANESLKEDGFQIGDKLTLSSTDVTLSIVGFT